MVVSRVLLLVFVVFVGTSESRVDRNNEIIKPKNIPVIDNDPSNYNFSPDEIVSIDVSSVRTDFDEDYFETDRNYFEYKERMKEKLEHDKKKMEEQKKTEELYKERKFKDLADQTRYFD